MTTTPALAVRTDLIQGGYTVIEHRNLGGSGVDTLLQGHVGILANQRLLAVEAAARSVAVALDKKDIDDLANALSQLAYETYATGWAIGVDLDAVVAEIHRANLSKLDDTGRPLFREDGKVLKGPNYAPPNIKNATRDVYPDPQPQELVRQFHHIYGQPNNTQPVDVIDSDTAELRKALISEEVREAREGLSLRDPINFASELADILYVTYGTSVSFGLDTATEVVESATR